MTPRTDCDLKAPKNWSIREIIRDQKLTVHFQTIVSLSRKMVIGLEGLIRGIGSDTEALIPPDELFEAAQSAKVHWSSTGCAEKKCLRPFAGFTKRTGQSCSF